MRFFTSEKVAEHMTAIRTCTGEYLYLIEGNTRAILVDTSTGLGHLRKYVEQLTAKPITVLLTHGHVDHAPGASGFEDVHLNRGDLSLYRRHCQPEERLGYLESCLKERFKELKPEDYVPTDPMKPLDPLEDGDIFDLGQLHVRAVAFPGHTAGSMAVLVEESRLLILGDACNNSTFLFDGDADTVESYRTTVASVRKRLQGRFDRVFISHHSPETGCDIMDNVLSVCDDILTGRADDIPYRFMGMDARIAKAVGPHFVRIDGKTGNVVYSKEKIWNN